MELGAVQKMIQNTNVGKPIQFRSGQVLTGTIKKLYPNQLAEVQSGNRTFFAKLEVPLQVGEKYWFQVMSTEEGISLKVLTESTSKDQPTQALVAKLLDKLSLPFTIASERLATKLVTEQWPLTKEMIVQSSEWLSKMEQHEEGLSTIKWMMNKSIPFNENVFLSLLEAGKKESIQTILTNVMTNLQNEPNKENFQQVIKVLNQLQFPLEQEHLQSMIGSSGSKWLNESLPFTERFAALTILKSLGVVSQNVSITPNINQLQSVPSSNHINDQIKTLQQAMATGVKSESIAPILAPLQRIWANILSGAQLNNLSSKEASIAELLSSETTPNIANVSKEQVLQTTFQALLKKQFMDIENGNQKVLLDTMPLLMDKTNKLEDILVAYKNLKLAAQDGTLPKPIAELMQQLLNKADDQMEQSMTAPKIHQLLKEILRLTGTSYEARLASGKTDSFQDQLKPLLVQLLTEHPSPETKDSAEKLLNRMNGHQLLSGENGPLQTILYQIPLPWMGNSTGSIQWTGKRKENGQLDPEYCRILFHLDLANLKEVTMDMQVQNRIVTITIYHPEKELNTFSKSYEDALKKGLKQLNYHLSAIHFYQPSDSSPKVIKQTKEMNQTLYSGMDIKI
jgi:hypothetical protein